MKARLFMLSVSLVISMASILVPLESQGYTIWPGTATPAIVDSGPDSAVELGVKFRSDTSGTVTGIRFYKASTNTGSHVGNLWTDSGTLLATGTFSNESASGWQQVDFATPVAISANTVYVASYHTNSGHYSDDQNFFASTGVDSLPLHALANGVSGANGVYAYGSGSSYPNLGWNSSNYWADVVFSATTSSDTTPPTVTAFSVPATASSLTVAITSLSATDNVGVAGYLVNESATTPAATASGWSATAPTSYSFATVGSKTLYAWAKDAAGNVSANMSAAVTITINNQGPYTIWPGSATPSIVDSGPDSAVELGVQFSSETSGSITGIRFYKASANTDTHIGNLWTSGGTLLATAIFSSETASGWQQVNFATPVAISANTVYVASYHTNSGHYSCDTNFFLGKGVDSPPLHAAADGASGINGVYAYGAVSSYPIQGWNNSNYWVDVVFSSATLSDTTPPTVTAFSVPATASTLTVPITSFTATDNVGVTGYLVNESAVTPPASGWITTAPASYTFATAGSKTLYAWAKDAAGNVSNSKTASVTVTLITTGGPEPVGWYTGDMHVHRSCGGTPESVATMFQKMTPQNLAVISLLADMGNGEVQDPVADLPLVNGKDASVSIPGQILHWDAEWHWDPTYYQYPHQALGGHLVALGLSQAQQVWQEYTYPIFQWIHQQGGVAGFAHMQYLDGTNTIPNGLTCCTPIEYPVEVALGASDFISEDVSDCGSACGGGASPGVSAPLCPDCAIQAYYKLLNCGFRPGFAAGTDYPCNCSHDLGTLLTYVQVAGGQMTYRNWIDGIAAGRTVVSRNGHNEFISLTVNGSATPGDEINLTGGGNVQVAIQWTVNQSLTGTIELINNGVVVASQQTSATASAPATLSATVNFTKSGWLAARRMGSDGHQLHTAAVFVTVDNAPVRTSVADAQFYVQWIDNLLEKTSPGGAWNSYFVNSLSAAQARYQSAKTLYQQIALDAGTTSPSNGTIFSSQTPGEYDYDASYELGTKFWADVNGQVTQVRIYTNAMEGGSHTVRIWRAQDSALVAGPYTWDITSGTVGWKQFTLPTPLNIVANTDYIVSVTNSSDLYYAGQLKGFDTPIVNGHLHTYQGSGVYSTVLGTMPTSIWDNTSYFRDVQFVLQ